MVVWEDPELTPTCGNTKYTLTCRAVSPEKDSRTDGTATAYRQDILKEGWVKVYRFTVKERHCEQSTRENLQKSRL